jgi:general secretion pathway protein J
MSLPAARSDARAEGGFTLVEALLAVALLATLGAIVFGSLLTTTQVVDAGRAAASREQMIRRVLRLMAEELAVGVKEPANPWLGMNGTQDGQAADTLAFVTIGDGFGAQSTREGEMVRVIYTREGDRLIRFVRRNLYGLTDESVEQVNLATKVKGFNIRYYNAAGKVWADEWSSTGPLPTALLLEITFQEPDAEPYTIREWVTVGVS